MTTRYEAIEAALRRVEHEHDIRRVQCNITLSRQGGKFGVLVKSDPAALRFQELQAELNVLIDARRAALAMPDDPTYEESSVVVPDGWKLYSADFSLQAIGKHKNGSVTLIRDNDGRKEWHKLSEEDQEKVALYAIGYGVTVNEATEDAVQAASLAYSPELFSMLAAAPQPEDQYGPGMIGDEL